MNFNFILLFLVGLASCGRPEIPEVSSNAALISENLVVLSSDFQNWTEVHFFSGNKLDHSKLMDWGNASLSLIDNEIYLYSRSGRGKLMILNRDGSFNREESSTEESIQGVSKFFQQRVFWKLYQCTLFELQQTQGIFNFSNLDPSCADQDIFHSEKIFKIVEKSQKSYLLSYQSLFIWDENNEIPVRKELKIPNPMGGMVDFSISGNEFFAIAESGNYAEFEGGIEIMNSLGESQAFLPIEKMLRANLISIASAENGDLFAILANNDSFIIKIPVSDLETAENAGYRPIILKREDGYQYNVLFYGNLSRQLYVGTTSKGLLILDPDQIDKANGSVFLAGQVYGIWSL